MQANYGGIRVDLPKSLQNIFNEGEEEDKEEESQVEEGEESHLEEGEELPSQDAGEDSEPMEGGGGTMEASGSLDETWGDMSIHTTRGEEEEGEGEGKSSMELQMNWNICTYLPEAGSCQNAFQVYIYIYIHTYCTYLPEAGSCQNAFQVYIYIHTYCSASASIHNV